MKIKKIINLSFSHSERESLRRDINLHFLQDVECNVWDESSQKFISKYPDKETEEFRLAHAQIHKTHSIELNLEICPSTGRIISW